MNIRKLLDYHIIKSIEADEEGRHRRLYGCFGCGLLPNEKGLDNGGMICPTCNKRS